MFLVGRTDGWFQQAIKDPARNETSRDKRPYKHAGASKKAVPEMAGTHKVTVGAPDAGQRTWELPKALLARHSTLFASLFQDYPNREGTEFPTVSPSDFANLVDYMRSNIYSLNTQVSGFRAIRANTDACVLGIRLEVKNYSDAALIHLHDLFLSFVRLRHSNARLSLIRASDIKYVCDQTSDNSATRTTKSHSAAALKQLFFDAIAAHWTARDILSIGAPSLETPGDTTTWTHVYGEYHDFRVWIVNSATTQDSFRAKYLLPQSKYIKPPASRANSASSDDTTRQEDGSEGANTGVNTNKKEDSDFGKTEEGEVKTPRLKLRLKMPNMRQSSNDHRRKATSGSSAQDLEGMRQASGAGAASEEAVDDMEVDEVDQMDIGMDAGIEDERD